MSERDHHWPSNKQHSFIEGRCTGCGTVPRDDGIFYPCGSHPVSFNTPQGQITGGITEDGGFAVLEWPDSLTEATAQSALDEFMAEHFDEISHSMVSPRLFQG
jgi:hypothetical protein